MKRAKIMLSILGVLAVVSSALALKAHRVYKGNLAIFRCSTVITPNTTTATLVCPTTDRFNPTTATNLPIRFCTLSNAPANEPCFATTRWQFNP